MEEKKQILSPNKRFKRAPEQDLTMRLNLDTSESLMRVGDKDIVLDIDALYDKERNESVNYKIYGKLKMVFRNLYSGSTDYIYLKDRLYLKGRGDDNNYDGYIPYDEYAILRKDVYREIIDPISVSGSTLGVYTPTITITGYTGHTTITPITAPYQNWNLYLSYVFSADTETTMTYTLTGNTKQTFQAKDGIPFRLSSTSGNYYELTSPVEHGINQGEYVTLTGTTLTGDVITRTFYVNSVGNEIYNSEKYVINLDKNDVSGTTITGSTIYIGKRCLDINDITGTTSSYYVHKHKIISTTSDYILDNVGFESPIWEDEKKLLFENFSGDNDVLVQRNRMESLLYDFIEPIKLSGITNNLGYTPTEVYVTVLLRNGNGYFNYPPKIGWKFNFHDTWIDEHFSGNTSLETSISGYTTFTTTGFTFTGGTELSTGTTLTGAFIEYNSKELKERVISDTYHKFTIRKDVFNHNQDGSVTNFSGATPDNMFGLIYQPHYKVKLRELSPYTETARTNDIFNLPENAKYDRQEKVWRWRDLYTHGYVDVDGYGTDFPFVNGNHYVKTDINFYLKNERYYTNKSDGVAGFDYKAKEKPSDC
jgi:hypothetical protein